MMKKKLNPLIIMALLVSTLISIQIQNVMAPGNVWSRTWHSWAYYTERPINLSTTKRVTSSDLSFWVDTSLVASIYQYTQDGSYDTVNIRVAVYVDSFASEDLPVPLPAICDYIQIFIEKDTGGSNLNSQKIEFQFSDVRPLSQGRGLVQSNGIYSTPGEREERALHALATAVGLFAEPLGVALDLIEIAQAFSPGVGGGDFYNADYGDLQAYSYWHWPGYDFGTENPIRQYAFNTIKWLQNPDVNPTTYYGIRIRARVGLIYPNPMDLQYFDIDPVYLKINHYTPPPPPPNGGGGCPYLLTWDGTDFSCEGLLDIHDPEGFDVVFNHMLVTNPAWINGKYEFRLIEHPQTQSHIDQVKLYAVLEDGTVTELPLTYAWHSEQGNALPQLLFSDDSKTTILGADHNSGTSQSIDLKFASFSPHLDISHFVFQIEGNNPMEKYKN
ncbi:MAG: hypothetical protein JSV51_06895 [Candidatus Bathyarchaeota archaeon]|nr:MAG: hypothetical protein JSV51_06895 [Candidatus Bathyarchaeota archaeon]